jgi:hypothetical protein
VVGVRYLFSLGKALETIPDALAGEQLLTVKATCRYTLEVAEGDSRVLTPMHRPSHMRALPLLRAS